MMVGEEKGNRKKKKKKKKTLLNSSHLAFYPEKVPYKRNAVPESFGGYHFW